MGFLFFPWYETTVDFNLHITLLCFRASYFILRISFCKVGSIRYQNRSFSSLERWKSFNCIKLCSNQWIMKHILSNHSNLFVSFQIETFNAFKFICFSFVNDYIKKSFVFVILFLTLVSNILHFHVEFNYSIYKLVSISDLNRM